MAFAHKMPPVALEGPNLVAPLEETPTAAKVVAIANDVAIPINSPALALQSRLEGAYSAGAELEEKWSARRSIAFAIGASLGLWTLIGLAVRALIH